MGEQPQGEHHHVDGEGGVKTESLIRDDAHRLSKLLDEIIGDILYGRLAAHEDGDVLLSCPSLDQPPHGVRQACEDVLPVVLRREQRHLHISLSLPLGIPLLDVVVGACQQRCLRGLVGRQLAYRLFHQSGEDGVVKLDDALPRPVVGRQCLFADGLLAKRLREVCQQSPVTLSPAVDALLHVTDDEVARSLLCHAVVEQHLEVAPLYLTGVLKLVDHDVAQLYADLFVEERRVRSLYHTVEQSLRITEHEAVGVSVALLHRLGDGVEQSQFAQMGERLHTGVVFTP